MGSDAFDVIFLRRILVEELEAIRARHYEAVELAASFKRKVEVVGVRSVVRAYLRPGAEIQSRVCQHVTRRQFLRNRHLVNKNLSRLRAIAEVATRPRERRRRQRLA